MRDPKIRSLNREGSVLVGVIGVFLANLLQPLVNYFDVESTPLVNSIIVAITLLIIFSVILLYKY